MKGRQKGAEMIFSSIHTQDDYSNYPKAVQRAIEYLKSNDFTKMETGVYEIEGKQLYAQVFDAMTEPVSDRKPEVHEKYLDVQFLVTGREKLGFTPDTGHYEVDERFDERDLIFYKKVEKALSPQHQDVSVYSFQQMYTDHRLQMENLWK